MRKNIHEARNGKTIIQVKQKEFLFLFIEVWQKKEKYNI